MAAAPRGSPVAVAADWRAAPATGLAECAGAACSSPWRPFPWRPFPWLPRGGGGFGRMGFAPLASVGAPSVAGDRLRSRRLRPVADDDGERRRRRRRRLRPRPCWVRPARPRAPTTSRFRLRNARRARISSVGRGSFRRVRSPVVSFAAQDRALKSAALESAASNRYAGRVYRSPETKGSAAAAMPGASGRPSSWGHADADAAGAAAAISAAARQCRYDRNRLARRQVLPRRAGNGRVCRRGLGCRCAPRE